jgi:predicted transport protein
MLITFELLDNWNYNNLLPIDVRTDACYLKYLKFKNDLKVNDIKLKDYLLDKYLNNKMYDLVPNDFPYAVDKDMAHFVLWVHPDYENKLTDLDIIQIIKNKMEEHKFNEYYCFENDVRVKTVLDILHYQVFFRWC